MNPEMESFKDDNQNENHIVTVPESTNYSVTRVSSFM